MDVQTVQTSDHLDLGGKTLIYMEVSMLHWPDSMATFLKEDRILFSNDGFGQHIATSKRYDFKGVILSRMQLSVMQYTHAFPYGTPPLFRGPG